MDVVHESIIAFVIPLAVARFARRQTSTEGFVLYSICQLA